MPKSISFNCIIKLHLFTFKKMIKGLNNNITMSSKNCPTNFVPKKNYFYK